jgi:homocysteine S-methyltransferase
MGLKRTEARPLSSVLDPVHRPGSFLLLDGGLATGLQSDGHDLGDPLWSGRLLLEDPAAIEAVHRRHLRAGARILTTASYQLSHEAFYARGLGDADCLRAFRRSVQVARQAIRKESLEGRAWVAGSLGAFGAFLNDGSEYRGHYPVGERGLVDFHARRVQCLVDAGPDLIAFETIPCAAEARAIARLFDFFPDIRTWVSFVGNGQGNVAEGQAADECLLPLIACPQVVALGVNCTAPKAALALLRKMATLTGRPLLAYPNNGDVWDARTRTYLPQRIPIDFSRLADSLIEAGARVIGGCCRLDAPELSALARGLSRT